MKIANIIPIFKSGAKTTWEITGQFFSLPQVSNILERLFLTRLDNFVNAKDILSSSHCSFRTAMSTSGVIMVLIEEIF